MIPARLGRASQPGPGPIQEVARRQGIPSVTSSRFCYSSSGPASSSPSGLDGGYQLIRAPEAISVGEVPGGRGTGDGLEVAGRHPGSAAESTSTDLAPLWREIAGAVAGVTDRVTFGDLAEQVKARRSPSARSTTSDQRSPRKTMAGHASPTAFST